MPELPEVETVKNHLLALVKGNVIKRVKVLWPNLIANVSTLEFEERLMNQKILDIKRFGKILIFCLDDYFLLSHLRMEGKYILKAEKSFSKHDHVIFYLETDKVLIYNDVRKFGKFYLFAKMVDIYKEKPLSNLGLEANSTSVTLEYLSQKIKKTSKPIKAVLLDQSVISGLGNIYANEVLFKSRINPYAKANSLNELEMQDIIKYSKIILDAAIKEGGTTIRTFKVHDINGRFQNSLNVHMKEKCNVCGGEIIKEFINKRSVYYCGNCQKPKE